MKKRVMFVMAVLVVSLFITGFTAKAAEKQDYYSIVKNGVAADIEEMKDTEDYIVISVKTQECVSEKVCTFDVTFIQDYEQYRLVVYLNGYLDEATAILYDSEGDVYDQNRLTLEEAAQDYI